MQQREQQKRQQPPEPPPQMPPPVPPPAETPLAKPLEHSPPFWWTTCTQTVPKQWRYDGVQGSGYEAIEALAFFVANSENLLVETETFGFHDPLFSRQFEAETRPRLTVQL